ncbi:MAG: hypothetical protein JW712_12345 [Dehalococcoidales bacterium]|nr:hypothetical protein [Dehalococcoidales bacterium]
MEYRYNKILRFFEEYITVYSEYGQNADTIQMMDKFYAHDLIFPDDMVTGRDQWYGRCLNHPDVQDKLTIEHIIIDDKKSEVGAILKTQAVDRANGEILMELRMNAMYKLRIDENQDIKITEVRIFLESNPEKVARLAQLYRIGR